MRRLLLMVCLSCLTAATVVPAASTGRPPRVTTAMDRCHAALSPGGRYAVFSGTMRSLRQGADRMRMRFELYERDRGATAFKHVTAPGLGVWNPAKNGVRRFRFRQKVANLSAPASYRAVVSFRWLDADGRVITRTSRQTPACLQRDLRPDLVVGRVSGSRLAIDGARYDVTVRNAGGSAAPGFGVRLDVNGAAVLPAQALDGLAAGARQTVSFEGPRCTAGTSVVASVDPDDRVDEADEANDAMTVPCPLG